MKKFNTKRLLFLAYFWIYGIIGVAFILPIISWLIFFNVEVLQPYTIYAIFFSIGIPLCAMGIDFILGCIFEFDHISWPLLFGQSLCPEYHPQYHRKMRPLPLLSFLRQTQ